MYTNELERISIADYLGESLKQLHRLYGIPERIISEAEAAQVKATLNNTDNPFTQELTHIIYAEPFWGRQEVDYTPSNLGEGRGFIYYFICHECSRRVRHLYLGGLESPHCRHCFRLKYKRKSRRATC